MIIVPKLILKVPREGRVDAIDGVRRKFLIVDEIVCKQRVNEKGTRKIICFQQIKWKTGRIQYRFTYYMLGMKKGARGRWVFGQYSILIPAKQLCHLLEEARRRKWPGI
jgi:hypothetical protein